MIRWLRAPGRRGARRGEHGRRRRHVWEETTGAVGSWPGEEEADGVAPRRRSPHRGRRGRSALAGGGAAPEASPSSILWSPSRHEATETTPSTRAADPTAPLAVRRPPPVVTRVIPAKNSEVGVPVEPRRRLGHDQGDCCGGGSKAKQAAPKGCHMVKLWRPTIAGGLPLAPVAARVGCHLQAEASCPRNQRRGTVDWIEEERMRLALAVLPIIYEMRWPMSPPRRSRHCSKTA
jgi:hypothetical protein